jgi:hypothetical protein
MLNRETMLLKNKNIIIIIPVALIIMATVGFVYRTADKFRKEILAANEQELKVNLDAGFGNIQIERGEPKQILLADIDADLKNDLSEYIDYSNRDRIGYLNINTSDVANKESKHGKNRSLHLSGFEDNSWNMRFTDAIPISFEIELGMGKGNLDFTGLTVKDLNLSTGASSVVIRFDKPNKGEIENLNIETGLSKFKGYGLCNANFNHLKFEGGVGSYILDFSGTLDKEVDADIQVGLGSITISIPDEIGTKIYYEKSWVASIDLPNDFKEEEENNYYSKNYYNTIGKINLHIEAGLGSVKIKRE